MRRLLAALGWIRSCQPLKTIGADSEAEGCFTLGGPYFIGTAKGLEGPYWPALLGALPEGYLPEPPDTIRTFGDGACEKMLSMFGIAGGAKRPGKNS